MSLLTHRASWAMVDPHHWTAYPAVAVAGGRVLSVEGGGRRPSDAKTKDHGAGVIMPALVNAHTHLSLSALRGRISRDKGFVSWVEDLMYERSLLDEAEALEAAFDAVGDLVISGVGAVGEFGPRIAVEKALGEWPVRARIWLEFFGDALDLPELPPDQGMISWAYAAHAPHTVSPRGLRRIKEMDRRRGRLFCMHLAESREEKAFLEEGAGPWAVFLSSLGHDFSGWGLPQGRPVAYAHRLGLLDSQTLAVHLTQADGEDLELVAQSGASVCVCPRSNWNLHGKLPPLEEMIRLGLRPALGTDSLASVESLSIFDEMAFVASRYPGLRPDTILAMATQWGAGALDLPAHGTLRPGAVGDLIFVSMDAASPSEAASRLVHGEFDRVEILRGGFSNKEDEGGL